MAAIRSRDNVTTERRLRAMLVRAGLRGWRVGGDRAIGSPDFVFAKRRLVVFVDGCFWHGCPRCGHVPRTNTRYWAAKIATNRRRDRQMRRIARARGYAVIRVWECDLRRRQDLCLARITGALANVQAAFPGLGLH